MKNGIILKIEKWFKKWFKKHLPDEKIQTGEQVNAILKNKNGEEKCIRSK